ALVVLGLPRLAWTQWLRFADPFGDHPPFSRVLFQVQPGDVQVIYGAGLEIRVATEGQSVERLDLVLESDGAEHAEMLPLFREPAVVRGAGGRGAGQVAQCHFGGSLLRARAGGPQRALPNRRGQRAAPE